jgi:hypothetical protein
MAHVRHLRADNSSQGNGQHGPDCAHHHLSASCHAS